MNLEALEDLSAPSCNLCPRKCLAHRAENRTGYCAVGYEPVVAQVGLHFGEENCLVAGGGSGTVFFSGCNLLCIFCQNTSISHKREGKRITVEDLAEALLTLQKQGAANANLVTPAHFAHAIARAVVLAREKGFSLPVVYNCGGYDSIRTLEALEGLVDIYMPDIKTLDRNFATAVLYAPDYPEVVQPALLEMHRQVGDLVIKNGRAVKGLLVRHLVMPGQGKDAKRCLEFLKRMSGNTAVNVMGQYRPAYRAEEYPPINRRPTPDEIEKAKQYAVSLGLRLL